ncbi:MAG: ABC transporter ATP-binding protein [Anaerolineae bacterium]|nr:ABC transporter ATP-binding protein [Anaerolineae bacterium]MCB0225431.1 ABC transporter ATP-binding protein [Anaerolineae bacterium]MCB9104696.1 ABC transporter ATP-binding protein [Anaerolineales bacterium]
MPNLIDMRDIIKVYPNGVVANRDVNFSVEKGEIHALVGENGAGKSTLMKILYGLEQPTGGQIFLNGRAVTIHNSHQAINLGIGMVHQNFMLIPSFTVAENVVLGQEPTKRQMIDAEAATRITLQLAQAYGLDVDPAAKVEATPVGMRQRVEILKTLYRGADLLILDEPTAVLTPQETDDLFDAVRRLVGQGKTVIFITHKLVEVKEISDRVTVMRHGEVTGRMQTADVSEEDIARMMVGRDVLFRIEKPPQQRGEAVVRVSGLSYVSATGRPLLRNVSFNVYHGEILGIAGVEGNGQTQLAELLGGLAPPTTGEATIGGQSILGRGPRHVREAGVAHIPEDRLTNGVALEASIADNLVVDRYYRPPFTHRGAMSLRQIRQHAENLMQKFDIRAAGAEATIGSLSGGNMQKVIIAREFSADPALLIAAQPTRGVDIGASEFVRRQLVEARNAGKAVLLISADLAEILTLADRIAVMYKGEIVAVFPNSPDLSEEALGLYMLGLKRQTPPEIESHL